MPQLTAELIARSDLDPQAVKQMFALFSEHFVEAKKEHFLHDLANKNWIILLRDAASNCIQGFSTLALYETTVAGQPLSVVCSGDTVIRPAFWGSPVLPRTWIKSVLALSATMPQPLYWLLLSSGYKTYRFLTVFFRQFYPCYDQLTPPREQRLMSQLVRERFGEKFLPALGIVRFGAGATPLRAGIADVNGERLQDPHVAFFVARNPGYTQGDELVCLTQVHPDNLTVAGRRMIR